MNQISVLHPYKYHGQWVFDDETTGLVREAFVAGADTMIDTATSGIPNAQEGFLMLFSSAPFPGHQVHLNWVREESGGNIYSWEEKNIEGWLCPALLKYFEEAPKEIFVQMKAAS